MKLISFIVWWKLERVGGNACAWLGAHSWPGTSSGAGANVTNALSLFLNLSSCNLFMCLTLNVFNLSCARFLCVLLVWRSRMRKHWGTSKKRKGQWTVEQRTYSERNCTPSWKTTTCRILWTPSVTPRATIVISLSPTNGWWIWCLYRAMRTLQGQECASRFTT